jgi:LmbE family N-acetylglucosaminyl deacetylase
MRKLFFLSVLLAGQLAVSAQQVRPATSATIYHEISQLNHLVNVLYVAAHPDDENTRLLAWLVNDQNIRTAYLSLTRGDGGQNILGSEQGPALGLIRTHELLEARKIDGAEQYFTRAVDFGFSKNSQETFSHWNPDVIINDVVRVYRSFRPDIIIARFPPDARAGHGQHAASAIIAKKAAYASGDPKKYTDNIEKYPPWLVTRMLFNAYKFGKVNTTSEDQFKLKLGQYNPLLGVGYSELAGRSRSVHKSQGAGTPSVPGVQTEYFKLVGGDPIKKSLFDHIDITWKRVDRPDIGKTIDSILKNFNFQAPETCLPALLELRPRIETVKDKYWRDEKLAELDKLILHCAGLMAEVYTNTPQATDGATLPFTLHVIARSMVSVRLKGVSWLKGDTTAMNTKLRDDSLVTIEHNITIPESTPITEPYWLSQTSSDPSVYAIPNDDMIGLPEAPNELNVNLTLKIGHQYFYVDVPLSYKKLDPVKGDVVERLRIVPDVSLDFSSQLVVTQADGSVKTSVLIHPFKDISDATLAITEQRLITKTDHINLKAGVETSIPVYISAADAERISRGDFYLNASLIVGQRAYAKSQHVIQYSHIPTLQYFTSPYTKVLRNNWKCTARKIGYIEGAGDYTVTMLRLAGLQVSVLKETDLADASRLKQYDAIITGVRVVNKQKQMVSWMPVLLQYVENGGTLVMQYNTLQDLATTKLGPYPFTLSDERVTDENAKMTFLHPDNRILNYPNKITDADFKDWVQERGLYFASKWDDHYTPLFAANDAGEQPLKGSTLYCKYGKGHYMYTSLSFFRQLPAGNKGAIRLLMNMLSVGN